MISTWIAWRYFRSRRSERFLSFLTTTSILGVTIGVLALIVVLSIMCGFHRELTERLLGLHAHVLLRAPDSAQDDLTREQIESLLQDESTVLVTPFVEGEAIAQGPETVGEAVQGVRVRSLDPQELPFMKRVQFYFPQGKENFSGVILGKEVSGTLLAHPDFEDSIRLIAPLAEVGPTGELAPRAYRYPVVGVFESGIYEYDTKVIFLSRENATKLLGEQISRGWNVRLQYPEHAYKVVARLRQSLPSGWKAHAWSEENQKLFQALRFERIVMNIVLLFILLISSFSMMGVLFLMTASKRKDIGILRSCGISPRKIRRIFLLQGFWIGAGGSFLGTFLGLFICYLLQQYPLSLPSTYYLDVLPVSVEFTWVVLFFFCGIFFAMLAAFFPAMRAAKEAPCEVLRYE